MSTEFNELLSDAAAERAQIWIIGTREQVMHTMNECYVRRLATDRVQFTPIIPAPFSTGKYMCAGALSWQPLSLRFSRQFAEAVVVISRLTVGRRTCQNAWSAITRGG